MIAAYKNINHAYKKYTLPETPLLIRYKHRYMTARIIVGHVCLVLLGILFFTPLVFSAQAQTLVNYKNPRRDFTFQYPETWKLQELDTNITKSDFDIFTYYNITTYQQEYEIKMLETPSEETLFVMGIYEGVLAEADKTRLISVDFAEGSTGESAGDKVGIFFNQIAESNWQGRFQAWRSDQGILIQGYIDTPAGSNYFIVPTIWIQGTSLDQKLTTVENIIRSLNFPEEPSPPTGGDQQGTALLLRARGGTRVYAIENGRRHWIPSIKIFNKRGFAWQDIQEIDPVQLNQYPRVKLVRVEGKQEIYYLTMSGMIRHVPSADVFLSYGNRWEDVVSISQEELNAYPRNNLIRLIGGVKVYLLQDGRKQWIKTAEAFNRLGYDWNNIAPVNQTELDAYPEGALVE